SADGFDVANALAKTRGGRPIQVGARTLATANTSVNASVEDRVLSIEHSHRVMSLLVDVEAATWAQLDQAVTDKLDELEGQDVVLLTQTFASPTTSKLIEEFQNKYPHVRHVVYDPVSSSEALDAFQNKFGYRALPDYDFSQADVIVSVNADFLGDWQG